MKHIHFNSRLVLQNWVPKCDMEPNKLTTPNLVKFVCVLSL